MFWFRLRRVGRRSEGTGHFFAYNRQEAHAKQREAAKAGGVAAAWFVFASSRLRVNHGLDGSQRVTSSDRPSEWRQANAEPVDLGFQGTEDEPWRRNSVAPSPEKVLTRSTRRTRRRKPRLRDLRVLRVYNPSGALRRKARKADAPRVGRNQPAARKRCAAAIAAREIYGGMLSPFCAFLRLNCLGWGLRQAAKQVAAKRRIASATRT